VSPIALEDSIAIYVRPTSPFWWALLEGTDDGKGNPVRFSTKILIKGATPAQTKENRSLAYAAYVSQMGDVARDRFDLPSARGMITFAVHADWYETHHTAKHKGVVQERRKLARSIRSRRTAGRSTPPRGPRRAWRRTRSAASSPS
jgi:hypothetical protein